MGLWAMFKEGFSDGYSDDLMKKVDATQADALLEALLFAGFADGDVSTDEYVELVDLFMQVPALAKRSKADIRSFADGLKQKVQQMDAAGIEKRIFELGATFTNPELRERVFRMIAVVCHADKQVNDAEKAIAGTFAQAFGFTPEQGKSLWQKAQSEGAR